MLRLVDNQQHPGAWPPAHVSGTQSASGEGGAQPAQLNTQLIPQSQLPKCEFDRAKYDKAAAKASADPNEPSLRCQAAEEHREGMKRVESEAKRRSEDEVRTTAVSSKHEEAASTQVRAASKAEPIKRKKSRFFVD